jgi:hypothetical protein
MHCCKHLQRGLESAAQVCILWYSSSSCLECLSVPCWFSMGWIRVVKGTWCGTPIWMQSNGPLLAIWRHVRCNAGIVPWGATSNLLSSTICTTGEANRHTICAHRHTRSRAPFWHLFSFLAFACIQDVVLCYCSVYLCSEWLIQQIAECPYMEASYPPGLSSPLLRCYSDQSATLHAECVCGVGDGVAALLNRWCELFPRATRLASTQNEQRIKAVCGRHLMSQQLKIWTRLDTSKHHCKVGRCCQCTERCVRVERPVWSE